jgi:hypothetical protein
MKPEVVRHEQDGFDYAEQKGVIDEVRIRYNEKIYCMGFISFFRLAQDFFYVKSADKSLDLRGYDKHHVVATVTIGVIEQTVLDCEKDGSLHYYLEAQVDLEPPLADI